MRIKFDFGTTKSVDAITIWQTIQYVFSIVESLGLHAGKCNVYINMYDDDGLEECIIDKTRDKEINYIARKKEYARKPKDKKLVGEIKNGEQTMAYLYEQYVDKD